MIQIHLGCGKRYIPGFIHVDIDQYPHVDHVSDIASLPFFEDNYADVIYSCHALEYFDRVEVLAVLKEWKRVLKPGGVLRTAVPNLEALIEVYKQTGETERIIGPLFGRIEINENQRLYHKTVYDFNSLSKVLDKAGFSSVQTYDWSETVHKEHDDFSQAYFPHMDKENGLLVSLNVEAIK
jgi:predicted SAM-dependent methyltransferase